MNTLCTNVFFLISTIICSCSIQAARQLYEGDVCAADGSKCVNLKNCTILHDEVNRGKKPHLCGFNGKEVIVCCCPDLLYKFSDINNSISVDACQWYEDEVCPKNGTSTVITPASYAAELAPSVLEEKLPFAALIGYGMKSMISWQCGGVLISRKYVLAAAHCSNRKGPAKWVGFYNDNLSNISNIYTISVIFNHPDYHPPVQYNDIALYRLDRIVQFNKLVRPICLPQVYADYEFYVNLIGSGWVTRNKKPQAISNLLKVIPSGLCSFAGTGKEIPNGTDGEDVLCVNGYDGGHTGRCTKNFFGGPFFATDAEKCDSGVLLGILSIGKLCNEKDFTGIYTNITYFRPWIESIVWPENSTYIEIVWNH